MGEWMWVRDDGRWAMGAMVGERSAIGVGRWMVLHR